MIEGVNLIKIYYRHKCKSHNECPLCNYYLLIKKKKFTKWVKWDQHEAENFQRKYKYCQNKKNRYFILTVESGYLKDKTINQIENKTSIELECEDYS
jgi:tRNA splicing endonuclease